MTAAVLGSGSWGTALAILLARNGHRVALLGRDIAEIEDIRTHRENRRYLPGFELPAQIVPNLLHHDLQEVEMTVIAVPSAAVREVVAEVGGRHPLVVVCSKGLEPETSLPMTEVVQEVKPEAMVGVLSGPNLAVEIVRGIPTVAISAFADQEAADTVLDAFCSPTFRVSTSDDVVGVEVAGALKNVLAIGAGMSDGLGFGDNTKGAFLSRGLMEMSRLGEAMGGRHSTFLGPAGVGDLFATAASRLSRNYRVGRKLGEGATLDEALREVGQVAEGVPTAVAALQLAKEHRVDVPVFAAVEAVINGRLAPPEAVAILMERPR
ncbi:MAG TPA: NAD(P)H-dependent glycerol-3-phosphate dehydrogenase [Fimbriimonas sp.]